MFQLNDEYFSMSRCFPILIFSSIFVLPSCTSIDCMIQNDRVNYKEIRSATNLVTLSDSSNTNLNQEKSYYAPFDKISLPSTEEKNNGLVNSQLLIIPNRTYFKFDGHRYWLVINACDKNQLWNELKTFWNLNTFEIQKDIPSIGIMETAWAQNQADISKNRSQAKMYTLIDWAYSSSSRNKFRTRITQKDNEIEISIKHYGMQKILVGESQGASRWTSISQNLQLENILLQSLAEKLGITPERTKWLIENPVPMNFNHSPILMVKKNEFIVNESFDLAWMHVLIALDHTHFLIYHSDRPNGVFIVSNSDFIENNNQKDSSLKNLASREKVINQYRIILYADKEKEKTHICVLDNKTGNPPLSKEGDYITSILKEQFN